MSAPCRCPWRRVEGYGACVDEIQRQHPQAGRGPQEVRQGAYPALHSFRGEDGEVVRADKKKDQLTLRGFHAALGDLADAHELTGRLMFPQLFFLFSVQIDTSLPHCLHPHVRRLGAIVQQLIGFG